MSVLGVLGAGERRKGERAYAMLGVRARWGSGFGLTV